MTSRKNVMQKCIFTYIYLYLVSQKWVPLSLLVAGVYESSQGEGGHK